MSHGIGELDKGYVNGTTWHQKLQYVQLDGPVTMEQAGEVMNYPLEKCQLFDAQLEPVEGAYCIKRTDHNKVLVPMVGSKFTVENNINLLNFVSDNLLCSFEGFEIESVGTLFNGAVAFLNLKVGETVVRGDQSPTINRLMYYNPLGKGAYAACAHNIRVVCNNTLRAASADGVANETLRKFRHTASAKEKINACLEEIAEIKLGMKRLEFTLQALTEQQVSGEYFQAFAEHMYPGNVDVEGRGATMVSNKRDDLRAQFEGWQFLDRDIAKSRYGLLQAFTFVTDHGKIKSGDEGSLAWDGMVGGRAKEKEKALAFLSA